LLTGSRLGTWLHPNACIQDSAMERYCFCIVFCSLDKQTSLVSISWSAFKSLRRGSAETCLDLNWPANFSRRALMCFETLMWTDLKFLPHVNLTPMSCCGTPNNLILNLL
jgi:hypothetical protein